MTQGAVLGPLLVMDYKNYLLIRVGSSARLFANEYLLYKSIETKADGNNSNVTSKTPALGTRLSSTFLSRVHPYFHHTKAKHYSILLS